MYGGLVESDSFPEHGILKYLPYLRLESIWLRHVVDL